MTDEQTDNGSLLPVLKDLWETRLPFNRVLGFEVISLRRETVCVRIKMRRDLVGNFLHGTLHGGVISSVLDAAGGMNAAASVLPKMVGCSRSELETVLTRMGTIDLRVDYLRPGRGEYFTAHSAIMRAGNKVAVTRMEFHNDRNVLIAVGTGTYLVG